MSCQYSWACDPNPPVQPRGLNLFNLRGFISPLDIYPLSVYTLRKLTIIYKHPYCHEAVIASGRFAKFAEYDSEFGNKIFVYTAQHEPD